MRFVVRELLTVAIGEVDSTVRTERGFTLMELLVTLAIIGILAAIAIPAFGTYRSRAFEAGAISYMRSWPPAQELYLEKYGHYADADENLPTVKVPTKLPYDFSIDSGSAAKTHWWGRGAPRRSGLRYFYIDETGVLLASMAGPPRP